jgi:hypothetical protein
MRRVEAGAHEKHEQLEPETKGAPNSMERDFLTPSAFYRGAVLLGNHAVFGVHNRLATTCLAMALPPVNRIFFLNSFDPHHGHAPLTAMALC